MPYPRHESVHLRTTFDDSSEFWLAREIFIDHKPDGYAFAGEHPRLTEAETLAQLAPP